MHDGIKYQYLRLLITCCDSALFFARKQAATIVFTGRLDAVCLVQSDTIYHQKRLQEGLLQPFVEF